MSQRKLLLADDSITIQKVVNLTFADEGIEVVTVGDGDAAMERMNEFKPDLIMADVNMPGLNGYQICEKIKQSDDFSKTPVILLVGSFEPFDEAEARRVGADDFLTKPFQSIRQLVNKVTELLDADKTGADSREKNGGENDASENNLSDSVPNSNQFDDAGFDDEMIQTNQPGGYALDEARKFETKQEFESAEDWAKTEPLSTEEFQQFSISAPAENAASDESSDAANLSESLFKPTETMQHSTADLELDDDFLELPPDEDEEAEDEPELSTAVTTEAAPTENRAALTETDNQPELSNQPESSSQTEFFEQAEFSNQPEPAAANPPEQNDLAAETESSPPESEPPTVPEQNQKAESSAASPQLSPEMIDVIVQKVVERLSDKVVREISWEVVPQLADLIVKKMAEEKLKE